MSDRKVWFSVIGGGLLTCGGLAGLIYMKKDAIEQAEKDVASIHAHIDSARKLIEGTARLEREVIVLREMADVIKTILPNSEDVNNLIRTIYDFADEAEIETKSYKKKANARRQSAGEFDKVSYTLSLEGDIFQFLAFMNLLETHERFIAVPGFRVTAASRRQIEEDGVARHKYTLDIETYKYEQQGSGQPVRIEGYDRKRELLSGEINRRRSALLLASFHYRGPRGRRDPWIDPRVPARSDTSPLSVQDQMELVEDLRLRVVAADAKWDEVQAAENVLASMVKRQELAEMIGYLDEDLRRIDTEGQITYVPAQKRLANEVHLPLDELRKALAEGASVLGPSKEMLAEVRDAMHRHLDLGEYNLALEAFGTVKADLDLLKGDPIREEIAAEILVLAEDATILRDFEKIKLSIEGYAIIEGTPPAVLVNGRSLGVGDKASMELEIFDIRPGEIDFIYRGVILTKFF